MNRGWKLRILTVVALAGIACSEPEDPHGDPGITVVAGANQSDTVLTTFTQALVVDIVGPQGIAEGVIVRFDATLTDGQPTLLVAPVVGQSVFSPSTAIATDSRGRATVRVQLGSVAGPAEVRVSVPELGYAATVQYIASPGLAYALIIAPQDTIVEVGARFLSRSKVVDRHGNARDEPITLTQPSSNLSIQGPQITAGGPGRGTVTVQGNAFADVLRVFVGPLSHVTGLTATSLEIFETDGRVASSTSLSRAIDPFTSDWSPNGQMLVADDKGGGPLRLVLPDGQVTLLSAPPDTWSLYPEFSPDGQWIYYSRSDQGWHIRRMRPDGSEDQAIPFIQGNHAAPTLSPDGSRMAVVNLLPDRIEIYDVVAHTITEIAAAAHTPAWSPDGARIAFVNSTTHRIEVVNPDGSGRRIISPPGIQFGLGVDWTQDGLFILAFDADAGMIVALDPDSDAVLDYQSPGVGAPAARPR
ncbi:MAG TPA: hypothetical protein VJU15_09640 [Gemmatimonadales bacterium]|nr:hypothetical protein [Gemmatimonadales bacterium]